MLVRCKCGVLVGIFLHILKIAAAECDLEKIFRTPKDMSKVNFDHFEIVERNGFDRFESPTTSTSDSPPTKKEGGNVANAQVLVRFGGDDVHGSNHIMKIPPQCRHLLGGGHPFVPPPPAYYPPCGPHYYHPYPPPVPFVFPNYYFYKNEPQYLPLQLREYFKTHDDLVVDGQELPLKVSPSPTKPKVEMVLLRPRIMQPLNLTNEVIEENIAQSAKLVKDVKNDISVSVEETPPKSKISDASLNKQLDDALVPYRCPNCSQPLKMLVSYPIVNGGDGAKPIAAASTCPYCSKDVANTDDCKCSQCQCNKKGRFVNDIDDLITIVFAEILDGARAASLHSPHSPSLYPDLGSPEIPVAKLANVALDIAGGDCTRAPKIPLNARLDVGLRGCPRAAPFYRPNVATLQQEAPFLASKGGSRRYAPYEASSEEYLKPYRARQYFFPEPNVSVRRVAEKAPHYLKVTSRDVADGAPEPLAMSSGYYCKRCGQRHVGGNFCNYCGAPLVVRPPCSWCPKETRQLNDYL